MNDEVLLDALAALKRHRTALLARLAAAPELADIALAEIANTEMAITEIEARLAPPLPRPPGPRRRR